MRLWTVHPRYLDARGLVALWREGLLAQQVLRGDTRGYRHHPQLIRFWSGRDPLRLIAGYLSAVYDESVHRGYRFDRAKVGPARTARVLTETRGQLLYEWEHLKRKLRSRAPEVYRRLARVRRPDPHPLFRIVAGEVASWERARRALTLAILLLATTVPLPAAADTAFPSFDAFLGAYRRASDPTARAGLARSFVEGQQAGGGFPAVQPDGSVVFFYVGTENEMDVRLLGDFRTRSFDDVYWDEEGIAMKRAVPGGAVFFRRLKLEADARIDYTFRVGGAYRLDPLNPRVVDSGMVEKACELVMPDYRPSTASMPRAGTPKGVLRVVDEAWAAPKITIYLPPGYDPAKRYPAVYTADGSAWIRFLRLPTILDNLIADGAIEPVIAVMIDPAEDRRGWYRYNPEYLTYLDKVVEYVDQHYSSRNRPEARLHVGSSAGGRAAVYAVLERPALFGNLAMFSPSVSGPPEYLDPYFEGRRQPGGNPRIWLSAGTYEGYIYRDAIRLGKAFRKAGLAVTEVYTHEGHSFGAWRNLAPGMLEHFFRPGRGELQ